MAEQKKFGKWCAFKNFECAKTDCALKDPNTKTCVLIAINNNLYHIRKALENLDEVIEGKVSEAVDKTGGPGLI